MTVAPLADDPEDVRPVFRRLRELRDQLRAAVPLGADGGWARAFDGHERRLRGRYRGGRHADPAGTRVVRRASGGAWGTIG